MQLNTIAMYLIPTLIFLVIIIIIIIINIIIIIIIILIIFIIVIIIMITTVIQGPSDVHSMYPNACVDCTCYSVSLSTYMCQHSDEVSVEVDGLVEGEKHSVTDRHLLLGTLRWYQHVAYLTQIQFNPN